MVKILVDSSSDYEPEEIKEKGFEFVPIEHHHWGYGLY